jgi:hypothetical protein
MSNVFLRFLTTPLGFKRRTTNTGPSEEISLCMGPVEVEVAYKRGHYQGSAQLRQHDFGMTPVTIAGGAVKVKDAVKIEFDFVLK